MSAVELVVVGDSFVEGRGDTRNGRYHGWVPRLATQLGVRSSRIRNLGAYQATTDRVVTDQLPAAAACGARLAGVVVGVNDLVSDYDEDRFARNIGTVLNALSDSGSLVFTASYPDIPARLPVPESFRDLLRDRFDAANEILAQSVSESGAHLLDIAADPGWQRDEMWSPDGLHPSPCGHQEFASGVRELIAMHTATTIAA
ncbi:GDSL-type esterase/lipase family protein [Tsukamurella sp. 8F]|uniref:GDSL-type esterase/lipase family protein n=1 Tax=unclassified Tsukamurella TaxID=2633480 RepID=UPI0023BA116E|nr:MULTISPECIES: GDSL-type esterase/lipase family protein [unclassified Tsukamurella]MDF0529509.1 GDSL-type esterase/lipase family protein [Tsukamurella sp. 8J]MDF0585803.1 GDSL-type esterase/lipase family protein [Tsukamurella sp. 8F]